VSACPRVETPSSGARGRKLLRPPSRTFGLRGGEVASAIAQSLACVRAARLTCGAPA